MTGSINAQARAVLKTVLAKRGGGALAGSIQSREVNTDDQAESSQAITRQETQKETQPEATALKTSAAAKDKKERGKSQCHLSFRNLPETN